MTVCHKAMMWENRALSPHPHTHLGGLGISGCLEKARWLSPNSQQMQWTWRGHSIPELAWTKTPIAHRASPSGGTTPRPCTTFGPWAPSQAPTRLRIEVSWPQQPLLPASLWSTDPPPNSAALGSLLRPSQQSNPPELVRNLRHRRYAYWASSRDPLCALTLPTLCSDLAKSLPKLARRALIHCSFRPPPHALPVILKVQVACCWQELWYWSWGVIWGKRE